MVMFDHPVFEASPPKSAAWNPSAFEPWMVMFPVVADVLVVIETVKSRKSPTYHAGLVKVEPEIKNRVGYIESFHAKKRTGDLYGRPPAWLLLFASLRSRRSRSRN